MHIIILQHAISRAELSHCPENYFFDIVKGVVDVDRNLLAIDAEMHADLVSPLLGNGSEQSSLWGINLSLDPDCEEFVIFDALINIRPWDGNRSIGVLDPALRDRIRKVLAEWIKD